MTRVAAYPLVKDSGVPNHPLREDLVLERSGSSARLLHRLHGLAELLPVEKNEAAKLLDAKRLVVPRRRCGLEGECVDHSGDLSTGQGELRCNERWLARAEFLTHSVDELFLRVIWEAPRLKRHNVGPIALALLGLLPTEFQHGLAWT
jgi:hypothetical protein